MQTSLSRVPNLTTPAKRYRTILRSMSLFYRKFYKSKIAGIMSSHYKNIS
jgi:hypothetical protein